MTKINELINDLTEDQLQDLITTARARQALIDEQRKNQITFPLEAELILHSHREDNYHTAAMLGLNDQQSQTFRNTAYEVKLSIRVHEDGRATLFAVQDVDLIREINI